MSPEIIELIIKWGPLALMAVTFVWFFIVGAIRGTYKVMRRLIYVILYVSLVFVFINDISGFVLDFDIPIRDFGSVRAFIVNFVETNETLNDFLQYSPELKELIIDNPQIILNPVLFIVLILVGLPLSFPIYWVYMIFWGIIMKFVLKREKYEKDEDGKILVNEKGKKIKVIRRKRRLFGGLVRGVQGVMLLCVSLLPVNFVNRLYNRAKSNANLDDGETLCSSIDGVEVGDDVCKYLDIYNETIFAKTGGENSLDKYVSDSLTSIKVNGEKVVLEDELGGVVETVVLINESGLLKLLMSGEINLETLDLSAIDFDKINSAIDKLFGSYLVSRVSEAGVKYVLNEVLNDKLVEVLKDEDIVSKLEYEDASAIKDELKSIVNIIKYAVEEGILDTVIDNKDNVVSILNNIENGDLEALLNKVLSLSIVTKAMPSVIKTYGEQYGVNAPSEMTSELNAEITNTFVNALKLVKSMELTNLEELTEGDLVENLTTLLFENGALKENTKDSLATLLHNINSSYLFKDVVIEQANKLLEGKNYKIDAGVLKYVNSKDSWLKELTVLEDAFKIYKGYSSTEEINYSEVTSLLYDLTGTKVLISILPFAYGELLPQIGIEVDPSKIPEIEFGTSEEEASKEEFYDTWESELVVLKNIADAVGVLKLQSLEDINADLFKEEEKVEALSTVMGQIYKSELLKEPFVEFFATTLNGFVEDFDVSFTKEELLVIDSAEKWNNEFSNIGNILEIDLSDESSITSSNLEIIFDSIGNMKLFESKKVDLLKYAVDMGGFLTEAEYNSIVWPDEDATQSEINAFYNNETSVLVNIMDKKDTIENLAGGSITDMNTDEVGELLNEVMKSNILRTIVVNKVSGLLVSNGVKSDMDIGEDTTNLKNTITGIEDWKVELSKIKNLIDSTNNIIETTYNEIVASERYNKEGNSFIQNDEGNYLLIGYSYYLIDNEYRYNVSGNEYVKDALGTHLKVTKTSVDRVFAIIENSEILGSARANLLLKAVDSINIVEVPDSVSVASLSANDYEDYEVEKEVIIEVSKKKNMFDNVASMNLASINTNEIGSLLDTVSKSKIFKPYLVSEIRKVFVNSGVKDDRDEGASVTNLENSIGSVSSWTRELAIIKDMLNITAENFDDKTYYEIVGDYRYNLVDGEYIHNVSGNYFKLGNGYYEIKESNRYNFSNYNYNYVQNDSGRYLGVTTIEEMFTSVDYSLLFQNSRANLLIKAISTLNMDGVNTNDVSVSGLMATVGDVPYYQYNKEVDVFVVFAENYNSVSNLSDITSLNGSAKLAMANVLNAMENSLILKGKYESIVNKAVESVSGNTDLQDYGITFKSADSAGDVDWINEIDNLIEIKNNISTVAGYTKDNITSDTAAKISVIGNTLDAIESSAFLGESSSKSIADSIIKTLTGNNDVSISSEKEDGVSWVDTFKNNQYISLILNPPQLP